MKTKWLVMGAAGIGILLGASGAAAQSYNPLKWIKKNPGPTANEQLAANQEEERKLSLQLQALLPPKTTLREACNGLLSLEDCVAALHVSRNLKIKYNCLKWDMTAARPNGDVKTCEAPPRDKALSLVNAIRVLNSDADAKAAAKNAERRAREDIKDATP
ncbi:MAG: hypothetical protein DMG41_09410 [Acidobacteria bacterium]|nr:MAG: hypothetical protein AUH13_27420 [Acidobacteria bacterium 13_2_20CM_58_27]PYT77608.1 MAG: hypothetical protein DMG42_02210 [Acidobacteriota bacterium]PYT89152.1 MAG: hypothetical protein DMG41_09410 [Acidobacteriota bacterium]